jgi:hypothetical protein
MRKAFVLAVLVSAVTALTVPSFAQSIQSMRSDKPVQVDANFMARMGLKRLNVSSTKMDPKAASAAAVGRVSSIPFFRGSFTAIGKQFSFVMTGGDPTKGGTTTIPTQITPIRMVFEGVFLPNGQNVVLDASGTITTATAISPMWQSTQFDSGFTQFGDGLQRAEFFSTEASDWHTLVAKPTIFPTVEIDVPFGDAVVLEFNNVIFALLDANFFDQQLGNILSSEPISISGLPITLVNDVFLFENGNPNDCCVLGFHGASPVGTQGNTTLVQTFIFDAWVDPHLQIFGTVDQNGNFVVDPDVSDINTLSHEVSEWLNDPFGNNLVPPWQFPDGSGCQGNLETGDPVEVLNPDGTIITLHGHDYHPQTEVMLPWFAREVPSTAIDGAYSWPDETKVTSPSVPCK